jgi:hypothetical protein
MNVGGIAGDATRAISRSTSRKATTSATKSGIRSASAEIAETVTKQLRKEFGGEIDDAVRRAMADTTGATRLTKGQADAVQSAFDAGKISKTSKGLSFKSQVLITAGALGTYYLGKKLYDRHKKLEYNGNITKISKKGTSVAAVTYEPSIAMSSKDKVILSNTNSVENLDGTHPITVNSRASFDVASKNITQEGNQGNMQIEPARITEEAMNDLKNLTGDVFKGLLETLGLGDFAKYIKWGVSICSSLILCIVVVLVVMQVMQNSY